VVANYKETQLAKMRVGQAAMIHIDCDPDKDFRGYVDSWSPAPARFSRCCRRTTRRAISRKIVQRVR